MKLLHHFVADLHRLPLADKILAGVAVLIAAGDILLGPDWRGPAAVNVVVVTMMGLSLAWRRLRPLLTLCVVMGGLTLLSLAFGASQAWASVFITVIAVYSVADHGSNLLVAIPIIAAAIIVRDLNDPMIETFTDALWSSSVTTLIFAAGLTGRSLHLKKRTIETREMALEREEAEVATMAVAEERRRIARELHDILSHNLGVLVLQAGAAEQILEQDPERAREALRWIRRTGQEAIGEMGTLLGLVRGEPETSREPQPSLGDLQQLVERTRAAGASVELEIKGDQRQLPAALELSAFRVVQEGLTNAVKHASSSRIRVMLGYREHELEVEVSNDGIAGTHGRGSRRGLAGLRERLAVFGGQLQAGPDPSGGWILRAVFPLAR